MAARSSRINLLRRGATTGQGAEAQREGLAPLPFSGLNVPPNVLMIDSLEEISGWLGAFRERLRMARADERTQVAAVVEQLEARYQMRRAELS
jgi:hypothetical protein